MRVLIACECPGPTQDGMEYETFHGVLMARPILGDAIALAPPTLEPNLASDVTGG